MKVTSYKHLLAIFFTDCDYADYMYRNITPTGDFFPLLHILIKIKFKNI